MLCVERGIFATWEFSLFSNFYNRLKRSSRRTYDMNEASLFIIPYDLSLDGTVDAQCNRRHRCTEGHHAELSDMLHSTVAFVEHNGLDHVVLWSYYQNHMIPKVCSPFLKKTCADCLITTTWRTLDGDHLPGTDHLSYASVPSPGHFHWYEGMSQPPWTPGLPRQHRATFVSLGRGGLQEESLLEYTKLSSSPVQIVQLNRSLTAEEQAKAFAVYFDSVFCVVPIVPENNIDFSLELFVQAVVAGCIPVITDTNFVGKQYTWHLTKTIVEAISVVYTLCPCKDEFFAKTIMAMCPEGAVAVKQRIIAKVAPLLQYSMPPLHRLKTAYDETTWDPPFLDAVDLALDGMVERAQHLTAGRPEEELRPSSAVGRIEKSLAAELEELKKAMEAAEMKTHECGMWMCG